MHPGIEAIDRGSRTERDREGGGGRGGGGVRGRGEISAILKRDNEGKEETKTDTAEPELKGNQEDRGKCSTETTITRQPFAGVGQLKLKSKENIKDEGKPQLDGEDTDNSLIKNLSDFNIKSNGDHNTVETSPELPSSPVKNDCEKEKNTKKNDDDDDLRGFFTMPTPSEKQRRGSHSASTHREHKTRHRTSPRATEICSQRDALGVKPPEASCEDRVSEWLSKTPVEVKNNVSNCNEDCFPRVPPDPVPQKPPAVKRHKMITRELVRLKMRANLKDQAKIENPLFQHRAPVLSEERPVSKPSSEGTPRPLKCINRPRSASKQLLHQGVKNPLRTPQCKPLFTGLRHVNVKSKPFTATITKTTLDHTGSSILRYNIDPQSDNERIQIHSAGGVPRMSYRHRTASELPSAGGASAMANLLPKAFDSPQTDSLRPKLAKVGSVV